MMCAILKLLSALVLSIALATSSPAFSNASLPDDPNDPWPADPNAAPPDEPNAPFMANVALAASPPYAKNDYKWRQREYIYGPDYVDEFVGILDEQRAPVFLLQDGNYNVTAVVNSLGALVEQYQYEPYGRVVRRTPLGGLGQPFVLRVGHQGLFFDRFDYVPGTPPLEAGEIDGVYYNRNRHYSPELGRFLQVDPLATALTIIEAAARNGETMSILLDEFDGLMQYGDGMNLYLYLGGNPVNRRDALGLAYDDSWVDEMEWELRGERLALLGAFAAMGAAGLDSTLKIASMLVPGAGIYDAYKAGIAIVNGEAGFWEFVAVAGVASPVIYKALQHSSRYFRRIGGRACSCFVAGTLVILATGEEVPIECVAPDMAVLTISEGDPFATAVEGFVTRVFESDADEVLWLTLGDGRELGATPDHEVWTFESGWISANELTVGEHFRDPAGEPVELSAIRLDPTPTRVYNLEVGGSWTYFAEGVWVHNNSCPVALPLNRVHGGKLHDVTINSRIQAIQHLGGREVRKHQALVNNKNQKVSNLKPDIQYIGKDGKVHIEEVIVHHAPEKGRRQKLINALGDAFGSYREHPVPLSP